MSFTHRLANWAAYSIQQQGTAFYMESGVTLIPGLPNELSEKALEALLHDADIEVLEDGSYSPDLSNLSNFMQTSWSSSAAGLMLLRDQNLVLVEYSGPSMWSPTGHCAQLLPNACRVAGNEQFRRLMVTAQIQVRAAHSESVSANTYAKWVSCTTLLTLTAAVQYFDHLAAAQYGCVPDTFQGKAPGDEGYLRLRPIYVIRACSMAKYTKGEPVSDALRKKELSILRALSCIQHDKNTVVLEFPNVYGISCGVNETEQKMTLHDVKPLSWLENAIHVFVRILLGFAKEFACDDGDFIRQLSEERQRNDYKDEISLTCCCALELLRNARLYQPTFDSNAIAQLGKVVLAYVMTVYSTLWSVPGGVIDEPNRPFGQPPDDCYYHACPHRFLMAANINAEADSPPEWLDLRAADWLWVQRSVVIVHYIINPANRDLDLDAAENALKAIREAAIRAQREGEGEAGTMPLFIASINLDIQGIRESRQDIPTISDPDEFDISVTIREKLSMRAALTNLVVPDGTLMASLTIRQAASEGQKRKLRYSDFEA
ncbi:hypothetical protein KC331_g388 [Hortaea werneckii]|nr:hypothetical protein KC361_g8663 [Hortaea werneckii]KAI6823142.1 hypothetical protein KC342_g12230 [Hortaea werneckii]KAI7345115.1 hypothetical protein KC320_g8497 [Hortaea werneckii]KAI7554665.1 hypothetical protein KC331_g388 [Hortaea werneckii]KAI7722574.1 hypothetical protein KC353_g385 [Hortaea werneckii]